ncbi:putative xyloglucan glycosyltransferase 5 [Hibiscus syriacus]|uniref:Xyloglucan glycosyltransferase 5 n=1 Tax=Hibiscus syriacus TaxID=106335 RepID=A0A6A2WC34_HIBSY|nr:putative xyloglucan glycosyltransferase 5 [Hibiscus syriacus]
MDTSSVTDGSSFLSLFAAISYGIASMAMVFINKAIIMQYAHSMTLLTFQQLATALLIHFGRKMGYTKAKGVDITTAKRLLPVSLFYNANVAFALASLKGVNIPMYIAIKRLTPLAVLIAGFFSGKGKPTTQVIFSVILTAVGVIVAAIGDFSFDLPGYTMALTSVFFQTMYLVLVEKSGAEEGLSSIEIMFYNINSALTTTIVGVLKGVGSTTLGFVLLGGVQVHGLNVTGLVINTAGGVWYSYAKYQQRRVKAVKVMSDLESHRT